MYFKRLADLRIDHDLSQKQVSTILNMHPTVYSRYERGYREMPTWAIIKLADFYETSIDYLVGRTDNPSAPRA